MIKMILVDDERIIRESLRRFIDWASIGVEICADAANGVTAMAAIQTEKPDIILTDIRMPSLNGLDLIRLLREQGVQAEVIFLSAYADFEYARKAISLGAFGYITKPINEEELLKTVAECCEKIRSKREASAILTDYSHTQEQQVSELLWSLTSPTHVLTDEEREILADCPGFADNTRQSCICACLWYDTKEAAEERMGLVEACLAVLGMEHLYLLHLFPEMIFVLFFPDETNPDLAERKLFRILADEILKDGNPIITMSRAFPWKENLSRGYTENALAYAVHHCAGETGLFSFRETFADYFSKKDFPSDSHTARAQEEKEAFQNAYFHKPLTSEQIPSMLREFVTFFFTDDSICDLDHMKLQFIHLIDGWVAGLEQYRLQDYFHKDVLSAQKSITGQESLERVYEVAYHLFLNLLSSLNEVSSPFSNQLVRKCLSYIQEHYAEDITLPDLAERFYVSPSYLSKRFSGEVGQPLMKYIQEYRITQSAKLLRSTDHKVYTIAQMCGFSDVTYYSRAFKAVMGVSPNQYRNSI